MKEILLEIIKTGLPLSIAVTVFAQVLMLTPGQQRAFFREHPLLMVRSLVAVVVLVPLSAMAIILLFKPSPAVGIGLAILAAAPVAPLQFINISKQGGSLAYVGALFVSLALLAIVTVPAVLSLLSQALGFQAEVEAFQIAKTVGQAVFLPLLLAIAVRHFFPKVADRIGPTLGKVAQITVYVLALPILVKTFGMVLDMSLWSFVVIAIFIVANLAIGQALGMPDAQGRTTLAMECAARNFGLAVAIGVLNFSKEEALPVFIPYLVLFVVISTIYLKWRKRTATPAEAR